jgi:sugar/nucleoside kinase (ribokinase family)
MTVITMGVHVLDVLVRPVMEIPQGQGAALVEDVRITAAGTAGGTALTLAKLGATVRSAGAIGTDATGDLLLQLLRQAGVDTSLLVRRPDAPTSASVLPIRPNGDRPTLHLLGANPTYGLDDVPWQAIQEATHLHLGGAELIGAETAAHILSFARQHGVVTSVDLLAPGALGNLDLIAAALPHIDYILPNDEQVVGFTGAADVVEGARMLLEGGAGTVAVTCGVAGALVVSQQAVDHVPAFVMEVVDTTGCGDAFSAGFLRGVAIGRTPHDAAILGAAAAAHVAAGLGSDHGDFDLATADAYATTTPTRSDAAPIT